VGVINMGERTEALWFGADGVVVKGVSVMCVLQKL